MARIHNSDAYFIKIIALSPKSLAGHRYPYKSEKSRTVCNASYSPPPPPPKERYFGVGHWQLICLFLLAV
jgi:hypothetical protein